MLSLLELRGYARSMAWPAFARQIGPFALVQRPPDALVQRQALELGAQRTVFAEREARPPAWSDALLYVDTLVVATLPPLAGAAELTVGRQPDCELVVDDPSVSKRHALLRWDRSGKRCLVTDLASTNGTYLNDQPVGTVAQVLRDGDGLAFGDAEYWFLAPETLHAGLTRQG